MLTHRELLAEFERQDRILAMAAHALCAMKGEAVEPYATQILGFLAHRGLDDPVARYVARTQGLAQLQRGFENTHRYDFADAPAIETEDYNLALLLSFLTTIHRFEILERLVAFYGRTCAGPARMLSVGFGTGYEIKLARETLPDWDIAAFDKSPQAHAYARDLLDYFGMAQDDLVHGEFPLERNAGLEPHEGRYGRVVACELLEHLHDPAHALRNVRRALHPEGIAFLTMAVNLAQEDHVFLYADPEAARKQVTDAGLRIVEELVTPVTVYPFEEADRMRVFKRGNYVCVASR